MIKRSLLTITLVALLALTSVLHADPPVTPEPPTGYTYSSETVNTSLSQSIGSNLVSDSGFDHGWWTLEAGWSISGGVATHITGSSSAFYSSSSLVENDMYEVQFDVVSTSGAGGVLMALGVYGSETPYYGVVGTYQSLLRYTSSVPIVIVGAAYNFGGSVDNVIVRPVTQTPNNTATADGTHTLLFSLPASTLAGQRIEMRYRVQDAQNYLAERLQRNPANNNWDLSLVRVVNANESVIISQSSIGNIDALRVMSVGSSHYIYTGASGTYTQWWSISESTFESATGLTAIYNGAFSASSLTSWSIVDESSITPTPTTTAIAPTPTATPDLVVYGNVNGQPTRYVYSVTAADHAEITILITILISIWALVLAALFILRNKS